MKTIKFFLATVVAVASFMSCSQDKTEDVIAEKTAKTAKPQNLLMYKEMVAMLEHYDQTRKPVLEKALGYEDTRVNTYPIQQLKDYIGYIENLCAQKNIPLTGVNIISAAYPEKQSGTKEAGYQTLIFMPTTTINGEEFVAFDPLKSNKGVPATFKSILAKRGYNWPYDNSKVAKEEQKAGVVSLRVTEDEDSSGANRMRPVPPY